jgi:hypothetical protein
MTDVKVEKTRSSNELSEWFGMGFFLEVAEPLVSNKIPMPRLIKSHLGGAIHGGGMG